MYAYATKTARGWQLELWINWSQDTYRLHTLAACRERAAEAGIYYVKIV